MADEAQQQTGGPIQDATGTLVDQSPKPEVKPETTTQPETKPEAKPEAKPESLLNDGAKKPEDEKKPEAKGAPDKYEFKLPEGYELDPKVSEEASTIFKELGLPQEAAQKLVDFYTAKASEAAQAPYDLWQKTQEDWVTSIKADPEIGGKLDQVKQVTSKAIDSLGPKLAGEFREAMNFTGAGNNPAFVRAFYEFAKQLTEGTSVTGGKPSAAGQSSGAPAQMGAHALYPKLP